MAIVGSQLLSLPKEEEGADFFDQLGENLGQRSSGFSGKLEIGEGERGDSGLDEAVSKLSLSHADEAAPQILHSSDAIQMKENASRDQAMAIAADLNEDPVEGSVSFLQDSSVDRNTDLDFSCECDIAERDMQDPISCGGFALSDADVHNKTLENAGSKYGGSQNLQSHGNDLLTVSSQSVVKELQWSIFSQIYTPQEESNALNEFLSELDARKEDSSNNSSSYASHPLIGGQRGKRPDFDTSSGSNTEQKGLAGQNFNDAVLPRGIDDSDPQYHGNEVPTNLQQIAGGPSLEPVSTGYSGEGDSSAKVHMQGDQDPFNKGPVLHQYTYSDGLDFQYNSSSKEHIEGSYASCSTVETHQEAYSLQQPWESMYPGWYYDYATNEWKQVESWNFAPPAGHEHYGSSIPVPSDSYSSSGAVNAVQSQSVHDLNVAPIQSDSLFSDEQNLTRGYSEIAGVSKSIIQEHNSAVIASPWSKLNVSTPLEPLLENEQMTFGVGYNQNNYDAISLQSQMQISWEEQYPGWYFDYQAGEWRQITGEASINASNSNSEQFQPKDDGVVKADQLITDQHAGFQEETRDVSGTDSGNKVALPGGTFFNPWKASRMESHFESNLSAKSGHAEEAVPLSSKDVSVYEGQRHLDGVTYDEKKSEQRFSEVYASQRCNQPQNFYGSATETKANYSPDGRPSHALVSFGFGGRIAIMKTSFNKVPETIVLHDLNQLIQSATDSARNSCAVYFSSLNRGGLAGPLVGSGVATKEILKWVDDRIANCKVEDSQWTESLGILWNVLRIACTYYGRLRPGHTSSALKTLSEDGPEHDLGRLLSASSDGVLQTINSASSGLQFMPSDPQLQSIAFEMRKKLIDGKKKEALELAQQGQLWGPALILASHINEKTYSETVLQMAQQQFFPGNPLRTLFLLLGGQKAELFSTLSMPSPMGVTIPVQDSAGGMLGDWKGNLSIIAANPTSGDEEVITHLGDCLWKDHGEVAGAHTCYLVAEKSFEPFSENARMCLIGADHFKWHRTFATPLSIQRTELYEYAKFLGNPQFILLPFQPYKLLYSHMLAEAGKISEARRYCQAVNKALKNAARTPEIEFCRQGASALEERLRFYSQGGYKFNSATGRFVGKFMGTLDSTLHRIMGGPPPRQASEPSLNKNVRDWYSNNQKLGNPKPHESSILEPSKQNNNWQMEASSRSVSEPNLSWTIDKKEHKGTTTSPKVDASVTKENKNEVRRTGYLSQLFSKAVGFIKSTKKADLGETNRFYYDEDKKRWVEEGKENEEEDAVLKPPPITTGFNPNNEKSLPDKKVTSEIVGPALATEGINTSQEMPSLPSNSNQFSVRGRLGGVRSRYVDTFNRGAPLPAKSTSSSLFPSSDRTVIPTPSQFFMSARTSLDKPAEINDQVFQFTNSFSTGDTSVGDNSVDNGSVSLTSKASFASLTTVPSIDSHLALNSNFRPEVINASTLVEQTASATIFHPINSTLCSAIQPFDPLESGTNSSNVIVNHHSAGQDPYSLRGPPVIGLQVPHSAAGNISLDRSDKHKDGPLNTDNNKGIFTDMQEVEL
ncbi:hypothetical protein KP509_11G037700 [Ceratopteris richardii]|uniref:Protein transport protein sec16 n=1 Tax=Ceratopteris richardii TaxID=49495 RepID=A0A8T2TQL4_CERRI|nr:hypothetical protein KP509_11G037700 [Ceratopteris richardii]